MNPRNWVSSVKRLQWKAFSQRVFQQRL